MSSLPSYPSITSITADSRNIKPGAAFIALRGEKMDGNQFIPEAVAKGAAVIVSSEDSVRQYIPANVTFIHHDNPREALSLMAAHLHPRQPEHLVAVTGTNGKTSTVHFYRSLWEILGQKSASIGTIGILDPDRLYADYQGLSLTTPDPVLLHEALEKLAEKGTDYVAMEASSHGLDQYRLDGVRLEAAAFTNLTRDHLDYHGTVEAYFAAKMHLFDRVLQPGKTAVLNADIPEYEKIAMICKKRKQHIIDYGKKARSLCLESLVPVAGGQQLTLTIEGKRKELLLPLVGEFQVYNVLCAMGLALASDVDKEHILEKLALLPAVPGRMEKVPNSFEKHIFVDYAHTPDALEKAILALKPHTKGKLFVIFGCGGDRDKGKRPQMGSIAAENADVVIVTNDNPRTEDPALIRQSILEGMKAKFTHTRQVTVIEIDDRKEAIAYAISRLTPEDSLLIAGKGHEKTQIIGTQVIPFDDVQVAISIMRKE